MYWVLVPPKKEWISFDFNVISFSICTSVSAHILASGAIYPKSVIFSGVNLSPLIALSLLFVNILRKSIRFKSA